jgi:hypothetical protein
LWCTYWIYRKRRGEKAPKKFASDVQTFLAHHRRNYLLVSWRLS